MKNFSTYSVAKYATSGTVGMIAFKKSYDLFKSNDKLSSDDGKDIRMNSATAKDKTDIVVNELNGSVQ